MQHVIAEQDLTAVEEVYKELMEWKSRLPKIILKFFQTPYSFASLFVMESELAPTERAEEFKLRLVYRPNSFYTELIATLRAEDEREVITEGAKGGPHFIPSL